MTESSGETGQPAATEEERIIHLEEAEAEGLPGVEAPSALAELFPGIEAAARGLNNPDPAVRERSISILWEADRLAVFAWVRESLRRGDAEAAELAAWVTSKLRLSQAASQILEKAAQLPPVDRGPFVGALSSLNLEPSMLKGLLPSIDPGSQAEAARILWTLEEGTARPDLEASLRDPAGPVRVAALEALGAGDDPAAMEYAQDALRQDPSSAVRTVAIRLLRLGSTAQRLQALDRALLDPNPEVRRTALAILLDDIDEDVVSPFVIQAMNDPDDTVRDAAIRWVAGLPPERDQMVWEALAQAQTSERERLARMLSTDQAPRLERLCLDHAGDKDPSQREMAMQLAAVVQSEQCLQAAAFALQDPVPAVRRAATVTLSLRPDPAWVTPLRRALSDPDVETRSSAARALSRIDDEGALDALVDVLMDPDPGVREAAGAALEALRSPELARRLIGALRHPELRGPAGRLLVRWGAFVVDLLADALMELNKDLTDAAGRVLQEIARPERFKESLQSLEPQERLRSVEALAAMGGPDAAKLLTLALSDPVEEIRIRSLQRLAHIGAAEQAHDVERCLQTDPVPEVAAVAQETLQRLRGGSGEG